MRRPLSTFATASSAVGVVVWATLASSGLQYSSIAVNAFQTTTTRRRCVRSRVIGEDIVTPFHSLSSSSFSTLPNCLFAAVGSDNDSMAPISTAPSSSNISIGSGSTSSNSEVQILLERAARIRAEIAKAEGKTVEEVENEARAKKDDERTRKEEIALARAKRDAEAASSTTTTKAISSDMGCPASAQLPTTFDDMVRQAARASERAFQDGIIRQTIRFNLVAEDQPAKEENEWPGGSRQMYRESGRPLAEAFLREIRAPTKDVNDVVEQRRLAPVLKQQDIWDFDGSALHTAEAKEGPSADIQAMVFPNTDVKYLQDIEKISRDMGSRLFVLINPFWRNVDSWGFNILAPGAKRKAQDVIFDKGFDVTYSMMIFSVRGESCAAVKAYPYDWQLFAFREDDYYVNEEYAIRLGSCKDEPTSAIITELLNARSEFKDTRTMRQMKKNIQG
jgi:hypothetical protein